MQNQRLAELEEKQLDELARDPRNIVYKYKSSPRLPDDQVVPVDVVKQNVRDLYQSITVLRKRYPTATQMQFRKFVLRQTRWKRFESTHPLFFQWVMASDTTQTQIDSVMFMISIHKDFKQGKLDNDLAKQILSSHIVEKYAKTPEEYQKEIKEQGLESITLNPPSIIK